MLTESSPIYMLMILSCSYCRYRKREIERQEGLKDIEQEQFIPTDETLSEMLDQSSGSGSGLPLLVRANHEMLYNRVFTSKNKTYKLGQLI